MKQRSTRNPLSAPRALAVVAIVSLFVAAPALAQPAPATAPATTAPTTRNANGGAHVTTAPGGKIVLNFKDASIDSVLDELSAVAGFIVVKVDQPQGRVTLVSKQPVTPDDSVGLLNTVLNEHGFAAIEQG